MSKLSFRARALDTTKPMPVLRAEDVPDLPDFAAINRAVPQMPTGMEKEEESEHHLQRAISAQQAFGRAVDHVIPTPEVFPVSDKEYDELYPPNFKVPRSYIHIQLQDFEQDYPEYNLDSDDEEWLSKEETKKLNINETKFEQIIECLEKSSGFQKVVEIEEAKALLKDDETVVISIYDYWLNKKLLVGKSLLPAIKTEKRDGSSGNNPYIAFRRRTEKMQTRKNRKNDETSYEKMLKLKRDFTAVRDILGMVKSREALKLNELKCALDIVEKRLRLGDYNGQVMNDIVASQRQKEHALHAREKRKNDENTQNRRKRDYKKRPKHDIPLPQKSHEPGDYNFTSDDESANDVIYQGAQINSQEEIDDNPDGQFAFKRKKGCNYHASLDNLSGWEWESPEEGGLGNRRFRFSFTSLSQPPNFCIGFARRRIGRGGRIIFDRTGDIDLKLNENDWLHFKPVSPVYEDDPTRVFNCNSENLSDDELPDDPNLIRLKGEDLLESHQYKYHESQLLSRSNGVICNSQHSINDTISPPSSNSPSISKSQQCKEVNFNLFEMNMSKNFFESINTDVCENLSSSEHKDNADFESNNSDPFTSDDNFDDCNTLNTNNCDKYNDYSVINI